MSLATKQRSKNATFIFKVFTFFYIFLLILQRNCPRLRCRQYRELEPVQVVLSCQPFLIDMLRFRAEDWLQGSLATDGTDLMLCKK